ncbi:hypothetical protein BCR43DRAFT_153442 [Syncephalastrum racemosum]|uniref:Secreted protein n=1 Tax=Syncephalastrum racemosum TaxID=13706 RepID=A0A1X2HPI4_SYNRA|nr:hypothetical protein BCR43DRAFT_153442 [Syncephalastrum racemosum]
MVRIFSFIFAAISFLSLYFSDYSDQNEQLCYFRTLAYRCRQPVYHLLKKQFGRSSLSCSLHSVQLPFSLWSILAEPASGS